jgi:glycerol-3-phosphate dehydrogenase (NAD(P)+)
LINILSALRTRLKRKKKDKNIPISISANVAIIGGGSWATALVKILSENGMSVQWWMRDEKVVKHIRKHRHNPSYLSDVEIHHKKVTPTNDLKEALQASDFVVLAVPAAYIQDALKELKKEDFKNKIVVSAIKGIIPQYNILVTDYIHQFYDVPKENLAVIAGPCHAEEVAQEKQSYLTISAHYLETAQKFSKLLENRYIKTSVNTDIYGVEYCAVMKNIIALACGVCHGLNYGDNFQAVLVSNAMQEISRFVQKIYPQERDMYASAYLGDLLVTSYSQFSRNRTFGNMIGKGYTVQSAQMEMNMVAEGYFAVKCIFEINQNLQVNMPITKAVYKILYEKIPARLEITILKDILR